MIKNLLLLILMGITPHWTTGQLIEGSSCVVLRTQEAGECKSIRDCPAVISELINRRPYTRCGFVGRLEIVCCQQPAPVTPAPTTVPVTSFSSISEQKCMEYSSAVYEEVKLITLIAGGTSQTRRVDKCGHKVIPLIVGGEFAKPREFPHMALVGFETGGDISYECGGALISDEYVLTAGHCTKTRLYGDAKYVRVGELDRSSDTDDARPEDIEIAQIINHPDYRSASRYNDIALLKLSKKITLSPYKRPACLPTEFNGPERNVIATGWGQTDWSGPSSSRLQKVTLEKFNNAECNETYQYEIDRRLERGIVDDTQMCAGSRDEMKDTCQGDSGGPIQTFHQSIYCMYKIVGVTSFGISCGNPGIPGVYTRVYAYRNWIESIVWGA